MHSEVRQKQPGRCPKCQMHLVPEGEAAHGHHHHGPGGHHDHAAGASANRIAIALALRSWPVVAFLVPIVLIQLASAPLSAHMVGRQAYRNGTIDERSLYVDELAEPRGTPPAAGG